MLLKTDEELMENAKVGDMTCISELFERYHVRLYNFYYQQSRDKVQSEDLTQNVFERIIKYKHQYKAKGKFASWLFSIARNVQNDLYRKRSLDFPGDDKIKVLADQPEEVFQEEDENQIKLKMAMKRLSGEQQQLLYLSRFEKMKYVEIAKVMDSTESAVKVKIHRTIKNLRKEFFKINIDE